MEPTPLNRHQLRKLCHIHFIETCRRLIHSQELRLRDETHLVSLAINQPTPYFYISPDYALHRIYQLNADYAGQMALMRSNGREMWAELYRRVHAYHSIHGGTLSDAVGSVLREQGAPRFYFNVPTGLRILRKYRKHSHI